MTKQTSLYQTHCELGAHMVDFAGWQMPIRYQSQLEEHHAVRKDAGMFDVSHMGVVDIDGMEVLPFLRKVLANDIQKTVVGQAQYSCMLNDQGGIIDDLIAYRVSDTTVRLVINAGRVGDDIAWLRQQAEAFAVQVQVQDALDIIAVQGPNAIARLSSILPAAQSEPLAALRPFRFFQVDQWHIARTGYTGEDGVEIILPQSDSVALWQKLCMANITPCGLGARDTLRLEAGLNLYGHDMDETTSPLVSNLAWTVDWEDAGRDFIGKHALMAEKAAGVQQQLVGLVMTERGVLRDQQAVFFADGSQGVITSGGFSPTLQHAIAFARVAKHAPMHGEVDRRGKRVAVELVQLPFVRRGNLFT